MTFNPNNFRTAYAPVPATVSGVPVLISGFHAPVFPDTMGKNAPYKPSQTVRPGQSYQLPGRTFRAGQKVETVFGVSFLCSEPLKGAQPPSSLSSVKHLVVEDASACQLECLEAGKNKCNVYGYKPSSFASNCTIGLASSFTKPLESTTDKTTVSGYCVPLEDVATSVFYPPIH